MKSTICRRASLASSRAVGLNQALHANYVRIQFKEFKKYRKDKSNFKIGDEKFHATTSFLPEIKHAVDFVTVENHARLGNHTKTIENDKLNAFMKHKAANSIGNNLDTIFEVFKQHLDYTKKAIHDSENETPLHSETSPMIRMVKEAEYYELPDMRFSEHTLLNIKNSQNLRDEVLNGDNPESREVYDLLKNEMDNFTDALMFIHDAVRVSNLSSYDVGAIESALEVIIDVMKGSRSRYMRPYLEDEGNKKEVINFYKERMIKSLIDSKIQQRGFRGISADVKSTIDEVESYIEYLGKYFTLQQDSFELNADEEQYNDYVAFLLYEMVHLLYKYNLPVSNYKMMLNLKKFLTSQPNEVLFAHLELFKEEKRVEEETTQDDNRSVMQKGIEFHQKQKRRTFDNEEIVTKSPEIASHVLVDNVVYEINDIDTPRYELNRKLYHLIHISKLNQLVTKRKYQFGQKHLSRIPNHF